MFIFFLSPTLTPYSYLDTIHLLLANPFVASDSVIERISVIKWIHIVRVSIAP